jgi:DNA-binding CsgD family transcriptional regulator
VKKSTEFLIKGPRVPLIISILIAILAAGDLALDLSSGTTFHHVLIMSVLTLMAIVGAVYFSNTLRTVWRAEKDLRRRVEADCAKSNEWHQEERELLQSLNRAINQQFDKWGFSPTEKDIALHLLKGLSMKEIARLRGSTDGTIKQQAHMLYHKAGLMGRAELSAHFLGGLLPEELAQADPVDAPKIRISG